MASLKTTLLLALAAIHMPLVAVATLLEERGSSICGTGIYGELAPILAQYPIAQAFCSAVFPVACTTAPQQQKRAKTTISTTSTSVKTSSTSTLSKTTTKSSAMTQSPEASAWSRIQSQAAGTISTLCSCIETPKVCLPSLPVKS